LKNQPPTLFCDACSDIHYVKDMTLTENMGLEVTGVTIMKFFCPIAKIEGISSVRGSL
jgi:hypothetical protein